MTEIEWGVRYNDGLVDKAGDREMAEAWAKSENADPDSMYAPAVVVYRPVIPWTVIETDQAPVLP